MMWEADEQDLWQDVPQRQGAANGPAAARGDRFVTGNLTSDDLDVERSLRPQLLDDYCGQEHIKQSLRILIEAAQSRGETLDHVIFSGPPGLGKTTLASVLANELGAQIKTTSGPAIERTGDLAAILTNLQPGDVLFIDEIHRLNRSVEEILYPAMEDFALDIVIGKGPAARSIRLEIPHFTLVGATTRSGMLTGPLRDRFGISFRLDYYAIEDLAQIVERSASILGVQIDHDSAVEIGSRSRGTPRLANRLLKRVRDYAQVRGSGAIDLKTAREALEFFEIDELGLDWMDIRILETLAQTFRGRAVGLSTLASSLGNFISSQVDPLTDTTAVLTVELTKDNAAGEASVTGWDYVPMLMVRRDGTERVFTLTDASSIPAGADSALAARLEEAAANCREILGEPRTGG